MKTLVGGAIAAVIGIIFLAIWFGAFLQLLAGILPLVLLLGGCLALYLGFDELKDTWKNEGAAAATDMDQSPEASESKEAKE
ncbi:MAG: hypothetical protein ACOCPQ_01100 [Desulfosudaceae bacterium]